MRLHSYDNRLKIDCTELWCPPNGWVIKINSLNHLLVKLLVELGSVHISKGIIQDPDSIHLTFFNKSVIPAFYFKQLSS